jgi:hypothetical protein
MLSFSLLWERRFLSLKNILNRIPWRKDEKGGVAREEDKSVETLDLE